MPDATAALYSTLHGLLAAGDSTNRAPGDSQVISLELASTRDGGIRYIVALNPVDVQHFKQLIISYLPSVRMREVEDYLTGYAVSKAFSTEFVGTNHFAFPLARQYDFARHDPIAYLAGSMTRPDADELFAFQLVISPSPRHPGTVRRLLLQGQDSTLLGSRSLFSRAVNIVFTFCSWLISLLEALLSGFRSVRTPRRPRGASVSPHTEHILTDIHDKLDQPLFTVSIRALVVSPQADERLQGIQHALHQFHRPGYQGLIPRAELPGTFSDQRDCFRLRTISALNSKPLVLSATELTSLYHFPNSETHVTENLVRSLHTDLPAPLPMKQRADLGESSIVVGMNSYHGQDTPIGLLEAEREKHLYVIGGTGNGKTTLMLKGALQDIRAGRGVAFIDPHGDAASELLRHIPKSRHKDVIYLNPRDITHPIGINLLEMPEGLSPDEQILEQERITEAVVGILRKLFADDSANAHRIESMLRNAVRTALTVPDATLFTVLKLLRNTPFRNSVVKNLKDEDLKDFWIEEFNHAGSMQRVSMTKGLTARLDRFRASAPAYRMFNQPRSTVRFDDILNSGKILICNFSTDMGEDTSALFGTSVLALLKIAAERRIRLPENTRKPFYVYVDEFQNFATQPFIKMLSSSRKYRLFLTIAEQSTAQQVEARLTEAILANIGTLIAFRTGSPADERLLLPWFAPYIDEGDISNLPAHHFYLRTRAVEPIEPVTASTLPLDDNGSDQVARQVLALSRKRFGTEFMEPKPKESHVTAVPKHRPVPVQAPIRGHIPRGAK